VTTDLETSTGILAELGARPLSPSIAERLDAEGYTVVERALDAGQVAAVRDRISELLVEAPRRDPMWRPRETLHLERLHDEGPVFDPVWSSPDVLSVAAHLLGPDFWVSACGYRAPSPGHGRQDLHRTFDAPVRPGGHREVTAIVALVDFTVDNGATQVVAGSHHQPRHAGLPDPRPVTCRAGDAIVFTEHLLHAGATNHGDERRDALIVRYDRRGAQLGHHPLDVTTSTFDRLGDVGLLLVP
jgi:ectoine hydroxylase-related dioxygenase (phytanoyl-CoA dioxygenase family)